MQKRGEELQRQSDVHAKQALSLSRHKWLQNTWAHSPCTMGYYGPVQQLSEPTQPRLQNTEGYMCIFWQ